MRNPTGRQPGRKSAVRKSTVAEPEGGFLASVFASAPDAVIVVDRRGIVLGWNRAAERRYGRAARAMIGRSLDVMLPEPERVRLGVALGAVERGEEVEPFDTTCVARDGRELPVRFRVSAVVAGNGEIMGASVVVRDDRDDRDEPADRDADRAASERFRRIFEANVFGLCYGEGDVIVEANDAFLEAIGAGHDDLRDGIRIGTVLVGDAPTAENFVDGALREFEIRRLDGEAAHLLAAGIRMGNGAGWMGVAFDLTKRKAAERAIAHLALHDPVTGLPNRRLLVDRLQQALSRSGRREKIVAVLFCDVDHFKRINDGFGHRTGDLVLQAVARRLESVLREGDTVARVGGDEFVVVLGALSDPTEATQVAERARIAVHEAIPIGTTEIRVTISIGVSLGSGQSDEVEALLKRADDAMYVAKQQGRDNVAFDNEELSVVKRIPRLVADLPND